MQISSTFYYAITPIIISMFLMSKAAAEKKLVD